MPPRLSTIATISTIAAVAAANAADLHEVADEVYFDLTRRYIGRESNRTRESLGDAWLSRLRETLDAAETQEQAWHTSEPRVWRRLLRGFWTAIGVGVPSTPIHLRPPAHAGSTPPAA